nr:hypothetical protein CDL15_Pgr001607 [Ipomoea batatas]
MRSSVGCSVARAKAPKESIMRLTQRSWTAVSATPPDDIAVTKFVARAATFTFLNFSPSTIAPSSILSPSFNIPHSMAMAFAVNILSPVIILIFTPAALQEVTASLAPGLHGSFSPINPSKIVVAEPIVSQAESFRTIALSRIILFIETARFSVTAKGKPSGIATTTIVTAAAIIKDDDGGVLECFNNKAKEALSRCLVVCVGTENFNSVLYSTCIAINPGLLVRFKNSRHPLNPSVLREAIRVPLANHVTQRLLVDVERGDVIFIFHGYGNK